MKARLLMVAVVVFLALGCTATEEATQAPVEKTTTELLVGTWKLVKSNSGLPLGLDATIEYGKDGAITMWVNSPLEPPEVQTGTYQVVGDTMQMIMRSRAGPRDRSVTIDSVTVNKLVTSGKVGSENQIHEFERVRGDIAQR